MKQETLAVMWRLFNNKREWLALAFALIFVGLTTFWVDHRAASHFKANLGENFNALLNANHRALDNWATEHLHEVKFAAGSAPIRAIARQLLPLAQNRAALLAAQAEARKQLAWLYDLVTYRGYAIVGPDNTILLSSADDANLGRPNPLLEQADTLARIWAGEAAVSRPLTSDVALANEERTFAGTPAAIFLGAPVTDSHGATIALLLLRVNPMTELFPLLRTARQSSTGESYIFDRDGRMLSESRFSDQLEAIGLLAPGQSPLLHLTIRDPGVDLTSGARPSAPRDRQPLTRMAASAIRGERDIDLDGYRDYRGVPVVGAWLWSDALAIGLNVKIDLAEAFQPLYANRQVLVGYAAFISILMIGLMVINANSRRAMLASQTRLQTLVDTFVDGVVVIDHSGRIDSINPAGARLFGYQSEELVGKNVSSLMPEPDRGQHDGYLHRFASTGEARVIGIGREVSAQRKDGTTFPADLSIGEMRLGNERYFTGILRDVSLRRAVFADLKKTNAKLEMSSLVARETDNAVIISDREGCILWVNPGFTAMTEFTLDEVAGRRPGEFLTGRDTSRSVIKRIREGLLAGKVVNEELLNYRKSGSSYWVQMEIRPVFDDSHEIVKFISLERDITERRQTMMDLEAARKDAEEAKQAAEDANRAKSAFLATMSHEIRTPMNGVVGMIDVLRRTPLNDSQRDLMDTVKDSAFALLTIIDDILDFSKIEAGRLELERLPVSLSKLIESVAETVLPMAARKGAEILIYCDPRLPAIFGDAVRLRQILFNLVGNAVKFACGDRTKPGQIQISAESYAETKKEIVLVLRVQDNGIGMSAETQARLFQPFVQGESSTTRRFGGTGLGLTISRRLIDMMSGGMAVQSEEGKGASFSLHLTCEIAPDEEPKCNFNLAGVSVWLLSMNENQFVTKMLRSYLTNAGARVELAHGDEQRAQLEHDLAELDKNLVMIIDKHGHLGAAEALRERIRHEAAAAKPRFVMLARGEQHGFHQETDDTLILNLDAMRRATLLHAVACAAGRASPEVQPALQVPASASEALLETQIAGQPILVAEDNETNQKVLQHQLGMIGCTCEIAGDGLAALEKWRQGHYALVLTDCHMPEMDGYELTRAIRREEGENRRTPIIAITADALKGTKEQCLAAGMDDYLPKPIQLNELQQKLSQWLPEQSTPSTAAATPIEEAAIDDNVDPSAPDVVDPGALKEVLGIEDKEMLANFYGDFLRTGEESVSALRTAHDARQSEQVGALAHRLKSSALTIGAHVLADCCLALEQAGKSADWSSIDSQMADLPNHFDAVQDWIKDYSDSMTER